MPQPPFKPKMWKSHMNKTNRHLVRRPWGSCLTTGVCVRYSLMTSSDGLMLQWRHWAGPLATHQPEQSVTHGSLLLITRYNPENTQRHRCILRPLPLMSVLRVAVCLPAVGEEISAAFSAPCLLMKGTCMEYLSADAWKSKAFERRVLQKDHITSLQGWYEGRTKCSAAGNSVWGADRLFIDIWTLHKCKALFTNQRLRVHIRIYNSYSMRRYCHSGRRGEIKDRERVRPRWWKKLFHRYRWWWSSASIWNQVFSSVSPEVSSVQQMDVTKPGG